MIVCKRCREKKPESEFKRKKGGIFKWCSACRRKSNAYQKVWMRSKEKSEVKNLFAVRDAAKVEMKQNRRAYLAPIISTEVDRLLEKSNETFGAILSRLGVYEQMNRGYNNMICVYLYLCVKLGETPFFIKETTKSHT